MDSAFVYSFLRVEWRRNDLAVLGDYMIVIIGVVYILFRCAGKYLGSYASAKLTKCQPAVTKYLGITLFPQAGVALGMAMKASAIGEQGEVVSNIVLFSVLVMEIIGPFLTKISLQKAGEISPEERVSHRGAKYHHFHFPHFGHKHKEEVFETVESVGVTTDEVDVNIADSAEIETVSTTAEDIAPETK